MIVRACGRFSCGLSLGSTNPAGCAGRYPDDLPSERVGRVVPLPRTQAFD
jgi:hypothetical protein